MFTGIGIAVIGELAKRGVDNRLLTFFSHPVHCLSTGWILSNGNMTCVVGLYKLRSHINTSTCFLMGSLVA